MARPLVRYPMPPMPGWGPLSPPTRPRQGRWAAIALQEILIFGALSVAAARSGWFTGPATLLAVVVARGLIGTLFWCRSHGGWREVGRALVVGVAIAALAVLAVGAPTTPATAKPKPKAVKVDAAQADQLADARCGVVNLYAQMAQGFPALPDAAPCPVTKEAAK